MCSNEFMAVTMNTAACYDRDLPAVQLDGLHSLSRLSPCIQVNVQLVLASCVFQLQGGLG